MRSSIAVKLFVGFLAVILLTSLQVLVAIGRLLELDSITGELTQKDLPEVHLLWKMRTLLSGMKTDLRQLLANQEPEQHLVRTWEKDQRVAESLATYRKLHASLSEEEEQLLGELATRYRSFQQATANVTSLVQRGEEANARALFLGRWEQHHQAALESLLRLLDYEDQEVKQRMAFAQAKSHSAYRMIITLGVVGFSLSVALALAITFSLTNPIMKLVEATEWVTQGDLASKAEITRGDEIGLLARRFNVMVDGLK
ncbi:MAG: MCP four helix bundle domain-containing protein, partial [Acidobacteriota bacterium]